MSQKVIVVFKKDTSQETIDKQVSAIEQNGGSVKMFDNPAILKGFSADIPDAYLTMLQSSVGGNGPISYIEPDSTVTTQ